MLSTGIYELNVYTELSGDSDSNNDAFSLEVEKYEAIVISDEPYHMDFESTTELNSWDIITSGNVYQWEIANIAGVGRTTVVRFSQILAYASQTVIKKLDKGEISIGAAYKSIKNRSDKEKNGITKAIKKTASVQKDSFIALSTIDDGTKKLKDGDIDMVMIVNNHDKLDVLKKNSRIKIGVYYINKG